MPETKKAPDLLPGGRADGRPDSDFPAAAVGQGATHEKEHTKSKALAREIAKDHLAEDVDYYEKLEKMEKGGGLVAAARKALAPFKGEDLSGIYVYVNPKTQRAHVDCMDWGEWDIAKRMGAALAKLVGKKNVHHANEEAKPQAADGWYKVAALNALLFPSQCVGGATPAPATAETCVTTEKKAIDLGGAKVLIDRPRGFKKTFPTPAGPVERAYPTDYGYFDGVVNPDDNEPADVFIGSGGPLYGRFMKGKNLSGAWEPDERKWYGGLTPAELEAVKQMFHSQSPDLLRDFQSFPDAARLLADVRTVPTHKTIKSAVDIASRIVIENPKGSRKEFGPDYPIPVMTYPVDYGSLPDHVGEDGDDLDFFRGTGAGHGSFQVRRPDVTGGLETKYWVNLTPKERADVLAAFGPVIAGAPRDLESADLAAEIVDRRRPAAVHTLPRAAAKAAALLPSVSLQSHQQAIADDAATAYQDDVPFRRLLVHGVGSGKSISAAAAAEALRAPYGVVAPAALRPNFRGEIQKATGRSDVPVVSYNAVATGKGPQTPTLIFDEVQRATSPASAQAAAARELAQKARNVILLSGTPVRNDPAEFANLFSILTGQDMTPEQFRDRYVGTERKGRGLMGWLRGVPGDEQEVLKNTDELKALLGGKIDYYKPDKPPVDVKYQDVEADLSGRQAEIYSAMFGRLPYLLRWKLKHNYGLTRDELARAQSFLTGPRQVALSTAPWRTDRDNYAAFQESGKLQKAMELMKQTLADPRAKGIVYSNFLGAGLKPYAAALEREKIPHAVFHGGLSDAERKALVDQYNANKLRVALVAPAGAEGISLKGAQLLQILDEHWNEARTQQAAGRGVRFDSHTDLPPELRNITIQRFRALQPLSSLAKLRRMLGRDVRPEQETIDHYLHSLSARKYKLTNQLDQLLSVVGQRAPQ